MNILDEKLYSTQEAATILGVTEQTVYNLVRRGELTPDNKDRWQSEGTYLFKEVDVLRLQEKRAKPGLSTGEAALILGRAVSTVNRYIKEGRLQTYSRIHEGKYRHFLNREEVEKLAAELKAEREGQFYTVDKRVGLFQPFRKEGSSEYARVIEVQNYGAALLTDNGEKISYTSALQAGFKPVYGLKDYKQAAVIQPGYATFSFPRPADNQALVYELIDVFYQEVGYNNMNLEQQGENILVQIKTTKLPFIKGEDREKIDLLRIHLLEGEIIERSKDIIVESNFERIGGFIEKELKEEVRNIAEKENLTLEEVLKRALVEFVQQHKGVGHTFVIDGGQTNRSLTT